MLITIPPAHEVVPGTEYKGFTLLPPTDSRADRIREVENTQLALLEPNGFILNSERDTINKICPWQIILPIGIAFALRKFPEAIPGSFRVNQDGEPVKIITSTRMLSGYDRRNYLAYFYVNEAGIVITSFVAEKPWASLCPSPTISSI